MLFSEIRLDFWRTKVYSALERVSAWMASTTIHFHPFKFVNHLPFVLAREETFAEKYVFFYTTIMRLRAIASRRSYFHV